MGIHEKIIWKLPVYSWLILVFLLPIAWIIFGDGIAEMLINWEREEYSHGYMIPIISLFLIWQQKDKLGYIAFDGSWAGVALVVFGVLLSFIGSLSAVIDIISYGFVVSIFGIVLALTGFKAYRYLFIPLLILLFMIPLPGFLYQSLSSELQLISSKIGVALIRLFDISVYLEGNVIDFGVYKLQVVEACSGLRYLFPLTALGFIAAYFFKVELWKRVFVFLSSIPITVLMNSLRVGVIGITVEYWGIDMAEGFLHDFEGWVVFMACIGTMLMEMAILTKIGKDKRRLVQVFGLELPEGPPENANFISRKVPATFFAALFVLIATVFATSIIPERVDNIPDRKNFAEFPMAFSGWSGRSNPMDQIIIDALNFDDYVMVDYINPDQSEAINLYIGYYDTQRADKVPHSPKACIPGGGWSIASMTKKSLDSISINGVQLNVNRLTIEKGQHRQLVYYWFQQRDRVVVDEYMVKLYLLIDSIRKQRTDGALVRFVYTLRPGEELLDADIKLQSFVSQVAPELPKYIPK